jgi:hypothetical protein
VNTLSLNIKTPTGLLEIGGSGDKVTKEKIVEALGYSPADEAHVKNTDVHVSTEDRQTWNAKADQTALDDLKDEISQSLVSESDKVVIADESGNIVMRVDAYGVETTTVTADSAVINGINLERALANIDSEIDSKVSALNTAINGKANSSHGNHVPDTQTANNAVFLRNDNTWQTVTPANIRAVPVERTVNGKALSANITLSASDVGALPSSTAIPTVNNAILTIQKNGTDVATFTANSASDVTANIIVPTGAAADKGVDTSIAKASTSTNLPTSKAVAAFVEGKGYKTTDNNTTYTFATGSSNGTISVTPSGGTAQNVAVKGLGSLAYKSSLSAGDVRAVPTDRTVNGKALSSNISLTYSDVGADASGAASGVQTNLNSHTTNKSNPHEVTAAQVGAVPTGRKVNGKALSSDITITANDIGDVPKYQYGTTDLTPGQSALEPGVIYFVYEP